MYSYIVKLVSLLKIYFTIIDSEASNNRRITVHIFLSDEMPKK